MNYFNLSNLGRKYVFADNDDKSDDDFLSLEELFLTTPLPNTSTEASKIENIFKYFKYLAPDVTRILLNQTKSRLDKY
jgi:hypothetical protein